MMNTKQDVNLPEHITSGGGTPQPCSHIPKSCLNSQPR